MERGEQRKKNYVETLRHDYNETVLNSMAPTECPDPGAGTNETAEGSRVKRSVYTRFHTATYHEVLRSHL